MKSAKPKVILIAALALLALPVGTIAATNNTISELFQQVVTEDGDNYVRARDQLLGRATEAKDFLNRRPEAAGDWRQKAGAMIVLAWIENPSLYRELWTWKETRSVVRNPFPRYRDQARARFSKEGSTAVPIMLELVWKKGETHYDALPLLLAETKTELAIPILVRKAPVPEALGLFGQKATPYILEVLRDAEPRQRLSLIQALGLGGDTNALGELRQRVLHDRDPTARAAAADSLGRLGDYATLRGEYFNMALEARLAALKALGQDHSEETRKMLARVATTAARVDDGKPYNTERVEAVRAVLTGADEKDIAIVCKIAPAEPHDYTRGCMYLWLSCPGSPPVREALLNALQDRAPSVQVWAIEGLKYYEDDTVTLRVLKIIGSGAPTECRRAGVFMLKDRDSQRVREAAAGWSKDPDPEIRRWAQEVGARNSATERR